MRYLVLLFLLIATPCFAGPEIFLMSHPAAGGGGTCTAQTEYAPAADAYSGFYASEYLALRFLTASSFNLTQIGVYLKTDSTPTGNVHAYLYSALTTSPGTMIATSTNTINAATITSSFTEYKFEFASIALTNATSYYVVVGNEQTDSIKYALDVNITLTYGDLTSVDTSSWSIKNDMQGHLITYSGSCP